MSEVNHPSDPTGANHITSLIQNLDNLAEPDAVVLLTKLLSRLNKRTVPGPVKGSLNGRHAPGTSSPRSAENLNSTEGEAEDNHQAALQGGARLPQGALSQGSTPGRRLSTGAPGTKLGPVQTLATSEKTLLAPETHSVLIAADCHSPGLTSSGSPEHEFLKCSQNTSSSLSQSLSRETLGSQRVMVDERAKESFCARDATKSSDSSLQIPSFARQRSEKSTEGRRPAPMTQPALKTRPHSSADTRSRGPSFALAASLGNCGEGKSRDVLHTATGLMGNEVETRTAHATLMGKSDQTRGFGLSLSQAGQEAPNMPADAGRIKRTSHGDDGSESPDQRPCYSPRHFSRERVPPNSSVKARRVSWDPEYPRTHSHFEEPQRHSFALNSSGQQVAQFLSPLVAMPQVPPGNRLPAGNPPGQLFLRQPGSTIDMRYRQGAAGETSIILESPPLSSPASQREDSGIFSDVMGAQARGSATVHTSQALSDSPTAPMNKVHLSAPFPFPSPSVPALSSSSDNGCQRTNVGAEKPPRRDSPALGLRSSPTEAIEEYRKNAVKSKEPAVKIEFSKHLLREALKLSSSDPRQKTWIQEGLSALQKLAEKSGVGLGHPEAQFFVAECYRKGAFGFSINAERAFSLYTQASKQNHPAATYQRALCYELGHGTKSNERKAMVLFRRAAAAGVTAAMCKLALAYQEGGLRCKPSMREMLLWYKRAAADANASNPYSLFALFRLGCYYEPIDVAHERSYAFALFREAAELGHKPSMWKLGKCYARGIGTPVDMGQATKWLGMAKAAGTTEWELENVPVPI